MATITKRLEKRYVAEGDELAHDALVAIRELREALQATARVVAADRGNAYVHELRLARAALAKHR